LTEPQQGPDRVSPSGDETAAPPLKVGNVVARTSLLTVLSNLLRRRRFVFAAVAIGGVGNLALILAMGRDYTAQAQFVPETAQESNLAGFAAQFGIDVTGFTQGESVVFYVRLLKSRDFLKELALQHYRFGVGRNRADTLEGDLLELYGVRGRTRVARIQKLIHRLENELLVSVDMRAEVVTIRSTSPWPELAEQISRRALDLVNKFNLEKRQSRGRAERQFVEGRLHEAERDLEHAEDNLRQFLERNRLYEQSPELAFEATRLEQRLQFRQQVHTSLAEATEEARIDEVRDTPVITVLEQPEGSAEPSRGLPVIAFLGIAVGGLIAVGTVLTQMFLVRQRQQDPETYAEFDASAREAVSSVVPSRLLSAIRGIGIRKAEPPGGH
jgi:uncharacterized protein involved in exopolysaccharide biosynthesis